MGVVKIPESEFSDDEFDIVDAPHPLHGQFTPADTASQPRPLPGGHNGRTFDGRQSPSHNQSSLTVPDGYESISDCARVPGGDIKSKFMLDHTKSFVQKFWPGQDLLIAVMGMTGSGKTTFISNATGRKDLNIGHSLTSCTRDVEVVETNIDGRVVRFVDTPGFSDTTLSDTEVLQLIADYLAAAYKKDMKLSGIIYVHPISDTRVTHHATKNLQMFQKLTGEKNLKNVILATSMWDKVTPEEGQAREEELKNKFWKLMMAYGAAAVRYAGTPESAQDIARMVMANKPFFLQLQQEMGKDNKALKDTAAGQQVMLEVAKLKEEHQRELAEMGALMKNTAEQSQSAVDALKEYYEEKVKDLNKVLADERAMNERAIQSLNERIANLESKGICAVM